MCLINFTWSIDLSWASIHAGISILNYYTFAEYNQRMFDYSKLKKGDI